MNFLPISSKSTLFCQDNLTKIPI